MSDDIVQKLRDIQAGDSAYSSPVVCEEAADEIERLRGLLNEIEAIARAPEVNTEEIRKALTARAQPGA